MSKQQEVKLRDRVLQYQCRAVQIGEEEKNRIKRRSDKVLEAFIGQGLSLGHGTCHLKIYKKNSFRVFLSKGKRLFPGSRSLISGDSCILIIDLMKD